MSKSNTNTTGITNSLFSAGDEKTFGSSSLKQQSPNCLQNDQSNFSQSESTQQNQLKFSQSETTQNQFLCSSNFQDPPRSRVNVQSYNSPPFAFDNSSFQGIGSLQSFDKQGYHQDYRREDQDQIAGLNHLLTLLSSQVASLFKEVNYLNITSKNNTLHYNERINSLEKENKILRTDLNSMAKNVQSLEVTLSEFAVKLITDEESQQPRFSNKK